MPKQVAKYCKYGLLCYANVPTGCDDDGEPCDDAKQLSLRERTFSAKMWCYEKLSKNYKVKDVFLIIF